MRIIIVSILPIIHAATTWAWSHAIGHSLLKMAAEEVPGRDRCCCFDPDKLLDIHVGLQEGEHVVLARVLVR